MRSARNASPRYLQPSPYGEIPLAALAAATGSDVGSLLVGLNVLPLGFGNSELDALELDDSRTAIGNHVLIESTAINIAGGLGQPLFDKIRRAFRTPVVAQAVVDDARIGARDAISPTPTATMGYDPDTGRVFYHEYAPGELERDAFRAESILGLFDGMTDLPNADEANEGEIGKWIRENGHLDHPTLATTEATLAVAERLGYAIYADDPVVRAHARRLGFSAFGTPSLLFAMRERGMVDDAEVDAATWILLRSGAQGIPTEMFDPVAACRAADWTLTFETRAFLVDRRRWNDDFEVNLRRWHDFLRSAVKEASRKKFRDWVFRVVDAVVLGLPGNEPADVFAVVAVGATFGPMSESERLYRVRLLEALEYIRFFYGINKRVGVLVAEWKLRSERSAGMDAAQEDHQDSEVDDAA